MTLRESLYIPIQRFVTDREIEAEINQLQKSVSIIVITVEIFSAGRNLDGIAKEHLPPQTKLATCLNVVAIPALRIPNLNVHQFYEINVPSIYSFPLTLS